MNTPLAFLRHTPLIFSTEELERRFAIPPVLVRDVRSREDLVANMPIVGEHYGVFDRFQLAVCRSRRGPLVVSIIVHRYPGRPWVGDHADMYHLLPFFDELWIKNENMPLLEMNAYALRFGFERAEEMCTDLYSRYRNVRAQKATLLARLASAKRAPISTDVVRSVLKTLYG